MSSFLFTIYSGGAVVQPFRHQCAAIIPQLWVRPCSLVPFSCTPLILSSALLASALLSLFFPVLLPSWISSLDLPPVRFVEQAPAEWNIFLTELYIHALAILLRLSVFSVLFSFMELLLFFSCFLRPLFPRYGWEEVKQPPVGVEYRLLVSSYGHEHSGETDMRAGSAGWTDQQEWEEYTG